MSAERAIQTVHEQPEHSARIVSVKDAILAAANNPNMDPARVEQFLAMYERLGAREAKSAFDEAMTAAQAEMGPVAADASNKQTSSKYATYAALDRSLRPIYTRHGFSLSFRSGENAPPEHIRVTCRVAHREGHEDFPHIDMPADGKGAKGGDVMTKTHATGAAFTYGQRYLLKAIFNIAVGDDDDQGSDSRRREQSAGATAAIASLNACNTLDELKAWKTGNAAMVQTLPEASEIIRLCNERVEKLKGAAR